MIVDQEYMYIYIQVRGRVLSLEDSSPDPNLLRGAATRKVSLPRPNPGPIWAAKYRRP